MLKRGGSRHTNNKNNSKVGVFDEYHYRKYQEDAEDVAIDINISTYDDDDGPGDDNGGGNDDGGGIVAESESFTLNSLTNQDTDDLSTLEYEPPEEITKQPDSLVDYTAVQREKEARVLEAMTVHKADNTNKASAMENETNNGGDDKGEGNNIVSQKSDRSDTTAWSGVYGNSNSSGDGGSGGTTDNKRPRTIQELKTDFEKGDKLLETRELKHNFVGYYVEE